MKFLFYIYILDLDNRGNKSKHYGHSREYYTGITKDIGRRIGDHLKCRGTNTYIQKYWKDARKIPVYVEYFYGYEREVLKREKYLKKLTRTKKEELIHSEKNVLVGYKPLFHLIIKKSNLDGEVLIKVR